MYSGVAFEGAVWAAPFGGFEGGGGGCDDGCVCISSQAVAEDERRRRGAALALETCRTHRRHAPKCRRDGVTDAMRGRCWWLTML